MISKKSLLTAAIAGLAMSSIGMPTAAFADSHQGECHGVNKCKGHGACHGKAHSCAGKNKCKGKGWVKMDQKACDAVGGKWKKS